MCTIYMMTAGSELKKRGGRAELRSREGELLASVPMEEVRSVVVFSHAGVSTPMVFQLLKQKAVITYLDFRGNIMGCMGEERGSLERLLVQQKCFEDERIASVIIRGVLQRKIRNQRELLAQFGRRKKDAELKSLSEKLQPYENKLQAFSQADELRGLEGMASRIYFEGLGKIFDARAWGFEGRNRMPPRDPVNSMLSYGYAFLEREVRTAIAGARLDPRIGFFHSNNGRKDSLVFDLMEMFRQSVIDRFVLRLMHHKVLLPIDFEHTEEDGCRFTELAKKKWIGKYEEYMQEERKDLGGKNWREKIQEEVEDFAEHVWQMKMMA